MAEIVTFAAFASLAVTAPARAQQIINGCTIQPNTVCTKANLSRADLRGVNLTGANLAGAPPFDSRHLRVACSQRAPRG